MKTLTNEILRRVPCVLSLLNAVILWQSTASGGGVFVVTNASDDPWHPATGSLRQAIVDASASGGGDILFSNVFGSITLGNAPLPAITNNVNITGPGAEGLAIQGGMYSYGIFNLSTGAVSTISGLTIRDGFAYYSPCGGAVLNLGGTLLLKDCVITNNIARGSYYGNYFPGTGGAISSIGGSLTCCNCTFSGNSAIGGPGADEPSPTAGSSAFGGAIYVRDGTLILTNCVLSGNSASGGIGGWKSSPQTGANGGDGMGGAVYQTNSATFFFNSSFGGNTSSGGAGGGSNQFMAWYRGADGVARGGAVAGIGGQINAVGCTLQGNRAAGLREGGGGGTYGGGLYYEGGLLILNGTSFVGNTALGEFGNGYESNYPEPGMGGALFTSATANLTNCVFSGNTSRGGGIVYGYFSHTGEPGSGGAIFNLGQLRAVACNFSGNAASGGNGAVDPDHLYWVTPSGNGMGGAIYNSNLFVAIDCALRGNSASGGTGNSRLLTTYASGLGGGIFNAGTCLITNSTFNLNSVNGGYGIPSSGYEGNGHAGEGDGGGIYNAGTLTVFNTTFYGGGATGGSDLYGGAAGRGGAVCDAAGSAQLNHCTIAANTASTTGGGIHNNSSVWLRNSILSGNAPVNYSGPVTDAGYNLSSDASCFFAASGSMTNTDPCLGPLTDNGGLTLTMALLPGSPAIDQGTTDGLAIDQRGMARPRDVFGILNASDGSDIGAYEFECTNIPPFITQQPASLVLSTGQVANFSVAAVGMGDPNLSCQWRKDEGDLFDSGNVVGAQTFTLTVSNVSLTDAGSYSVVVTNGFGSVTSVLAKLSVINPVVPGCVQCPSGIIAWWRGEDSVLDAIGTNHGTLLNGTTYSTGKVAQAFSFDGINDYISLSGGTTNLPLGKSPRTVETWVKTMMNERAYIFSYGADSSGQAFCFGITSGYIQISIWGVSFLGGGTNVNDGKFHHVAVTYDGTNGSLYCDGALLYEYTFDINTGSGTANIGAWISPDYFFSGTIDELSVYNRALTADEIASIYAAGSAGKCLVVPPLVRKPVIGWPTNSLGMANMPANLTNAVKIAAGVYHSLALRADGTVVGWGENDYGQTDPPAGLTNVTAITAGWGTSLALKRDGTLAEWGWDGGYGLKSTAELLTNITDISACWDCLMALKHDGTVLVWGKSTHDETNLPSELTGVTAIAGGGFHCLALKRDNTVAAWGDNSDGQVNVPAGLTGGVGIAAGGYHSLALRQDGTVVVWGNNSTGQTNVPPDLADIVAISGGMAHSIALKSSGSIAAWGDNSSGQTNVPANLTNVVAIAAGGYHNLALTGSRAPWTKFKDLGFTPNGQVHFTVSGLCGDVYQILASTNLTHWESLCTLTNLTGETCFSDRDTTNYNCRFYRCVMP